MHEKLRRIVADTLGINAAEIRDETAMENTPTWDSIAHLNLVMSIEQEFGIQLTPEEMLELSSIEKIERKLSSSGIA